HCLWVERSYAAASAAADWPVSDERYGWNGLHQSSVDMPAPFAPSASTEAGKSRALPTDAIFSRKPCCSACVQKVVKSGGIGTPVMICAFPDLNRESWLEKSSFRSGKRPGSTIL